MERLVGKIKNALPARDYGFIRCAGEEYFFHVQNLSFPKDLLCACMTVSFKPSFGKGKSPRALDVHIVERKSGCLKCAEKVGRHDAVRAHYSAETVSESDSRPA